MNPIVDITAYYIISSKHYVDDAYFLNFHKQIFFFTFFLQLLHKFTTYWGNTLELFHSLHLTPSVNVKLIIFIGKN